MTGPLQDCRSKTTSDPKLRVGSENEVGTWKVSGTVSHAPRPEGQHFKQDDPWTSFQMKSNSHWPNCWGLHEPLPLTKSCVSGSPLMAVHPQLVWGELRLTKSCTMSQDFFFSPSCSKEINLSVTKSCISMLKLFFVKLLFCVSLQAGRCNFVQ